MQDDTPALPPLQTVEVTWDDEKHEKWDEVVRSELKQINPRFRNSLVLLELIVKHSDGLLNARYEVPAEASGLLSKHPRLEVELEKLLRDEKPTYKAIRAAATLRNYGRSDGIPEILHPHMSSPRNPSGTTDLAVQTVLQEVDQPLREYLAGPPWSDFWKAGSTKDFRTVQFVNDLELPKIRDRPSLLLHNLNSGVIDDRLVNGLLSMSSKTLINTSGSGKTRLLFECLAKTYGFYFTAFGGGNGGEIGSHDLTAIVNGIIGKTTGFVEKPVSKEDFGRNHSIAERRVFQVLKARVLVFGYFWAIIKEMSFDPFDYKLHWLYLQLLPYEILRVDVFDKLANIALIETEDDFLTKGRPEWLGEELRKICPQFRRGNFLIALDEAQSLTSKHPVAFKSDTELNARRSVLRPIIRSINNSANFAIIISGTGLSYADISEVTGSMVAKPNVRLFQLMTETGAFDQKQLLVDYTKRYVPEHILASETGKVLIERVWGWCRGRHRFTATLLEMLIETLYESPHRTLNAFVDHTSGFTPTDYEHLVEAERSITIPTYHLPLNFDKLLENPNYVAIFNDALANWIMHQKFVPPKSEMWDLIQLGFARFSNHQGQPEDKFTVDEPLVILAVAIKMRYKGYNSIGDILQQKLLVDAGRGENFEKFVAYYLSSAFGGEARLCDVFRFKKTPAWAKEKAELVSIAWNGSNAILAAYNLAAMQGNALCVGKKCSEVAETVDWFKSPSSVMCFPDNSMGPDLVLFVRLESGLVITVFVRCKWRNTQTLGTRVLDQAAASLEAYRFYDSLRKNGNQARQSILKNISNLNDSTLLQRFGGGLPILKVIVSYPAVVENDLPAGCVTMNMDRCMETVDERNLVRSIGAQSIGRARESSPPRKKQKTG